MIKEHWKPIRVEVESDATDPHFCGPMVVEISPEGITWWWAGREHEKEPDGHLSYGELAVNAFLYQEEEIQEAVDGARAHLALARDLVAKADEQLSFKVLR